MIGRQYVCNRYHALREIYAQWRVTHADSALLSSLASEGAASTLAKQHATAALQYASAKRCAQIATVVLNA
jgi:hypothetical protein